MFVIQPMEEIANVVVVTAHVKDVLQEQIPVVQNVVIKVNSYTMVIVNKNAQLVIIMTKLIKYAIVVMK